MRLGFDLDGTVADLHSALALEASRLFPGIDPAVVPSSAATDDAPREATDEAPETGQGSMGALSSRQQSELWKAVCARDNFWETLDEIEPGALSRLYRLSRERRWEVIFLTSRPESAGDTAQSQSHRWLTAHGFDSPSIFVVHGSRGKVSAALALDVFVDDRPENCLDIAIDSHARAILVWRGDEENVPASAKQLGIGSVRSMAACLDILETLDHPESTTGGMVDRLKRLLGLTPKAARRGKVGRPSLPAAPPSQANAS